jgi:hypothetical protein
MNISNFLGIMRMDKKKNYFLALMLIATSFACIGAPAKWEIYVSNITSNEIKISPPTTYVGDTACFDPIKIKNGGELGANGLWLEPGKVKILTVSERTGCGPEKHQTFSVGGARIRIHSDYNNRIRYVERLNNFGAPPTILKKGSETGTTDISPGEEDAFVDGLVGEYLTTPLSVLNIYFKGINDVSADLTY